LFYRAKRQQAPLVREPASGIGEQQPTAIRFSS
jgi:hypothetical protein